MNSTQPVPYITEEEYLEGERRSLERHEYFDGEVFAMAGAADEHELVAGNFLIALGMHLRGKGCRVYKGDMRLQMPRYLDKPLYYYPDVMVTCDPADAHRLYRTRPKLVIEVLSDDRSHDWITKAAMYRRIETLEEYVIADPNPEAPAVHIMRREKGWEPPDTYTGMDAEFTLQSVKLSLKVADLFAI